MKLVAVILTKDEALNIAACIFSLRDWVDAVVVWDSGSQDNTCESARRLGALTVMRPFDNYAAQRQSALDAIDADWILFVDADERATRPLGQEIRLQLQQAGATDDSIAGFWVPRRNFIVGQETGGGGYSPDYQLRLIRRGRAHYVPEREVHEIVDLDGNEAFLEEPLIHYNYASWADFHRKQRSYSRYEARILASRGIRPRPHNFVLQPLREFWRRFVTLRGWQDGWHGLRLACLLAWYYGLAPYWWLATGDF